MKSLKQVLLIGILLSLGVFSTTLGTEPSKIEPIPSIYFTPIHLTPEVKATLAPIPEFRVPPSPKSRPTATAPTVKPKIVQTVPTVLDARRYARDKIGKAQYECLNQIFSKESGWDPLKYNKAGSGAYGIPQALPGSKMSSAGADWKTNPVTQVKWGIGYVNGRYGSACDAWNFWKRNGWY